MARGSSEAAKAVKAELGKHLAPLIEKAGGQSRVGGLLGVSRQSVKLWCDGINSVGPEHWRPLAEALGFPPAEWKRIFPDHLPPAAPLSK